MKNKLLPAFSVFLVLLACIGTAAAADSGIDSIGLLPDSFYGTIVMPDDQPVPANQIVEVTGEGVRTGIPGNPLLTHDGGFGGYGAMEGKLQAQGPIDSGTPLSFTVGGVPARIYLVSDPASGWQDTIPFISGDIQEVILSIDTTLTPGPVPSGVYVYPTVTGNGGSVVAYSDTTGGTTTGGGTTGGVANPASVPAYTTPPTRAPAASGASSVDNQQPGSAAQSGDTTAGSSGSTGLVQAQAPAGEPIPASWYIGGILIIVIIAIGGFYYGRMKKEGNNKTDKKE